MSHVALYRKYRPNTFNEVKGQSAIVQTLINQISMNRIGHAYLFFGPRGTGKTSLARILAKAVNCENPVANNPCCNCQSCKTIQNNTNMDLIEVDAASYNGVDNIRELIDTSRYFPQQSKYKIFIIDEVHMLSSSAFNALLKTLEEPNPHTIFILATTEEQKVPITIVSRCQRFQFQLLSISVLSDTLQEICKKESFTYEKEALDYLSKHANGGLRDAIGLLEQCSLFCNHISIQNIKEVLGEVEDDIVVSIAEYIKKQNPLEAINLIFQQEQIGKSLSSICYSLYQYFKNQYLNLSKSETDKIVLERYLSILSQLSERLKHSTNRSILEVEIIKLCKPQMEKDFSSLHHRLLQLEEKMDSLTSILFKEEDITIHTKEEPSTNINTSKELTNSNITKQEFVTLSCYPLVPVKFNILLF